MNRKQRERNRQTASWLKWAGNVCPECGGRGLHWVQAPMTLEYIVTGVVPQGFWTCDKFYGADGRRLEP